jgi:hypothetical protein
MTVPLLWSVDKPVPHEMHMRVVEWNRSVLQARGKKLREEAAIASSNSIRNGRPELGIPGFPNSADSLWMSVQEEKPGTMERSGDPLNEGLKFPDAVNLPV